MTRVQRAILDATRACHATGRSKVSGMLKLRVEEVAFPPDSDRVTLATGTDVVSGKRTRFVIPPNLVLEVLTALHAGRHPTIEVHEFDAVDWSRWW